MNRSAWILGCLVVFLGLIYFLTKEEKLSVGIKRLKLPQFSVENIDKIEILGQESVRINKKDGQWFLHISDDKALVEADPTHVESLLNSALAIKSAYYVTNLPEKYEELGLDTKASRVNLYEDNKLIWSLILGNEKGDTRYAKLPENNNVYAVKGSFWPLTRNGINDWRDRHIFPISEDMVRVLSIEKKESSFVIEKIGAHWIIKNPPEGFRANGLSLEALVHAVVNLNASDFLEQEIMGESIMTISLKTDSTVLVIEIFKDLLVKRLSDGGLFRITSDSFDAVNKSLNDMRDLSVLDFDKNLVLGLKIQHGKNQIVLAKDKNSWSIKEPNLIGFQFDEDSVLGMLALLSALKAKRAVDAKDKPENPKWQNHWLALIEFENTSVPLYASVNQANQEEMLIKSNQEVFIIEASRLKTLNLGINAFKKENYELPPVEANLDDLPKDLKRQVLDKRN
jgi:hypothetical protein